MSWGLEAAAAARDIQGQNNGSFDIWLCLISAGSLWKEMSQGFGGKQAFLFRTQNKYDALCTTLVLIHFGFVPTFLVF